MESHFREPPFSIGFIYFVQSLFPYDEVYKTNTCLAHTCQPRRPDGGGTKSTPSWDKVQKKLCISITRSHPAPSPWNKRPRTPSWSTWPHMCEVAAGICHLHGCMCVYVYGWLVTLVTRSKVIVYGVIVHQLNLSSFTFFFIHFLYWTNCALAIIISAPNEYFSVWQRPHIIINFGMRWKKQQLLDEGLG